MRFCLSFCGLLALIIILPGFGLRCTNKEVQQGMKPVELNYWRVYDGPDAFEQIIAAYSQNHTNVSIKYRKLRYDEYERELINALAEDRGPDIFSLHNTWLARYQNKLEPLPPQVTLIYPTLKGSIKKELFLEKRVTRTMTTAELEKAYVEAVAKDVVRTALDEETGGARPQIYGLPLALDSLVMYYNKDLFNNAALPEPPAYWNRDFQLAVKNLTKQDNKGLLIQYGVALGGGENIERAGDILSLLMMQNGTVMMDGNRVAFHQIPPALSQKGYNPGLEALRFYTDFANPAKEVYSWNKNAENSLELFCRGQLAIFFGYAYHLPMIKAKAPKLNFAIAPMPQIENNPPVNFANYWVEVVSKKIMTDQKNLALGQEYPRLKRDIAWDFLLFMAKAENVKSYLAAVKKPSALRSLVAQESRDPKLGVFASQLLTAKSWYQGEDAPAAEKIMQELINTAVENQQFPERLMDYLNNAALQVQQTVVRKPADE